MNISPEVILAELKKDPVYGKPDRFTPQLQDFAILLPAILQNRLTERVTAKIFFQVRRTCIQAAMDEALIYTKIEDLKNVAATLVAWERNPRLAFQHAGVRNERAYMLGPTVGLSDLLQTLYKKRELTVADIIRHQPALLFA